MSDFTQRDGMEFVVSLPAAAGAIVDMKVDGDDLIVETSLGYTIRVDTKGKAVKLQ